MDAIMPEPGSLSSVEEAGLRVRDLTMLEVFSSRERGVGDWEGVVGRIGVGALGDEEQGVLERKEEGMGMRRKLVLERTVRPRGSLLGVMVLGVREG